MEKITTIKSTVLLKFKDRKEENVVFGRCIYGIKEDDKCDIAIRKFTEDKTGNSKETLRDLDVLKKFHHENLIRYICSLEQNSVL